MRKKRAGTRTQGYVVHYIIYDMFTVLLLVGGLFLCAVFCWFFVWMATLLLFLSFLFVRLFVCLFVPPEAGLRPFVRPTRLN